MTQQDGAEERETKSGCILGGGMKKGYTYRSSNIFVMKVYEAPGTMNVIIQYQACRQYFQLQC